MKKGFLALMLMFTTMMVLSSAAMAVDLTAGGTIVLTEDVVLKEDIIIAADTVVDLNGHTIFGSVGKTADYNFVSMVISPDVSFCCKNGVLKNIRIDNHGYIPYLDSLTMIALDAQGIVLNRNKISVIQRCAMAAASMCVENMGDIGLVYDCDLAAVKNYSAIQNNGSASPMDADGKNTIDVIRHCRILSSEKASRGYGFGTSRCSGPTLIEDSVLLGHGIGGIKIHGAAVTAKNCIIIDSIEPDVGGTLAVYMDDPAITPVPILVGCTLIASAGACGAYDILNGEYTYLEHGDMRNCTYIPLSDIRDLNAYLKWEMESVVGNFAGLGNFATVNTYTAGQFADVAASYWGAPNIAKAYELGLMKGSSDSAFDPEGSVTVAQTVTMAARLHSIYTTGSENFVQSGVWYQTYVDYCKANGILEKDFADYNAPAKRADFAAILASALPAEALSAINQVSSIPDVAEASENGAAIYALYRAGILTGNDAQGTFGPETSINRAAAAAILARMADVSLRKTIQL